MVIKRPNSIFKVCLWAAVSLVFIQNGSILALLVTYGIWKTIRKPIPHFTVLIFGGTLATSLLFIRLIHAPIVSDFYTLLQAAQDILAHDYSYQHTSYFSLWAYQTAFVIWEAFWLQLWDNPVCLEFVEAVLTAGIACLLYRLSRQWVSEPSAQTASLLLGVFPFFATFHTLLSNQIPSAFFLTLSLWILACEDLQKARSIPFPACGADTANRESSPK